MIYNEVGRNDGEVESGWVEDDTKILIQKGIAGSIGNGGRRRDTEFWQP